MKLRKVFVQLLSLSVFISSICFSTNSTKAESNDFLHRVNANYAIREDKSAFVDFRFTTTNKISNNYLQVFSLKLPFEPKNISTAGSETPINLKSVNPIQNNFYEIEIEILQPVYGSEKEFNWSFTFDVSDIVIEHGMQKVIFFPTFSEDQNINDYQISVNIPYSLGDIRYIYGNAVSSKSAFTTDIIYKKSDNSTSSFSILLGPEQEYFLETNPISAETDIILPDEIPYQEVFYTQFPKREISDTENLSQNTFNLKPGEKVQAFINTYNTYDQKYIKNFEQISNQELVNEIAEKVKVKNSNYELARRTYDYLFSKYNSYDYFTTVDTVIDLSNKDKTLLNPAELNKLFREVLTSLNVENRGVYGYVFPAQPFKKDAFSTEQHVWSEFWDGSKWIVVDPTWFIASRGADYFDKNSFHHVKFGNYSTFEELKKFLSSSNSLKLSPLTARQNQKKKIDG